MPDRTGLHRLPRGLDAVRKHPVVILCLAQPLQRQQTFHVSLCQPYGAISAMVLRRVEIAAVDRAHHPQHPLLGIQIDPLECQLLRGTQATATSQTAVLTGSGRFSINRFS